MRAGRLVSGVDLARLLTKGKASALLRSLQCFKSSQLKTACFPLLLTSLKEMVVSRRHGEARLVMHHRDSAHIFSKSERL